MNQTTQRRTLQPYAAILLLVLLASSLALAASVEVAPRVFEIAGKLRCPVCTGESVAQSASPTSVQMRELIAQKLAAGESEAQILDYFVARYGEWILLEPPRHGVYLVVWLLPVVVGLGILGTLAYYLRRWTRRSREPLEVDPAYLERVRRDLDASTAEANR